MKNSNQFKSLILGFTLVLMVTACSDDDNGDTPTPEPQTEVSFDLVVTSGGFGSGLGQALRFDGENGTFLGEFPNDATLLNDDPRDIVINIADPREILDGFADTNLFIVGGNNNLVSYSLQGDLIAEFIPPFTGTENGTDFSLNAGGAVLGPDGNLYLGSRSGGNIVRFDSTTGEFIDIFVATNDVSFPRGFVFDDDFLFLGNGADPTSGIGGATIQQYDGTTGELIDPNFISDENLSPLDVILGLDGNIYTSSEFPFVGGADPMPGTVRVYSSENGDLLQVIDPRDANGESLIIAPRGLGFGPDGLLYISSTGNGRVIRVNPNTGEFVDIFIEFEGLNGQALTFIPAN